uniref:Uncharacterized protein n=1 Tax=Salix viminalis TaxID=40686 RepID=A0A6N2M8U3_SALVM
MPLLSDHCTAHFPHVSIRAHVLTPLTCSDSTYKIKPPPIVPFLLNLVHEPQSLKQFIVFFLRTRSVGCPVKDTEEKLEYLDFVQVVAIYVVVCFSSVYRYAKENSGPPKPGVRTVEDTVRTVIGPVSDKFHDVPFQLLKFVDHKIDESLNELDRQVLSQVKWVSACEVQRTGVVDVAKNITKMMCSKYEPMAKELYCRYEPVVVFTAERGYTATLYLSLIPFERFTKVFDESVRESIVSTNEVVAH